MRSETMWFTVRGRSREIPVQVLIISHLGLYEAKRCGEDHRSTNYKNIISAFLLFVHVQAFAF